MLAPYPTINCYFTESTALVGEFWNLMYLTYTSIQKFTARLDLRRNHCLIY